MDGHDGRLLALSTTTANMWKTQIVLAGRHRYLLAHADGPNMVKSENTAPLAGIRVVDLSTSYAGPTATMYLADLGAEVIKVERPRIGDDARHWGPPFLDGMSAWFASANRNKRSISADIRSPAGAEVLSRLLTRADVLVQNFNPSKLDRLGLTPSIIRERHPRLIYCALSGFGLTGPDYALPGYDLIAQARSGLMSVTGAAGGPPQRVSTALSDIVAGIVAALAITAAIRGQERTGRGETIDVSLLDADLALMAPRVASFLAGEPEPRPSGATDSVLAIYQTFETSDRPIVVAVGNDQLWRRFCSVVGLDYLADREDLATNAGRRQNRRQLVEIVAKRFVTAPSDHWLKRLQEAGIPSAPVMSLGEVVNDGQVRDRASIYSFAGSELSAVRPPWRMESQPGLLTELPPQLGAHTIDILRELEFSEPEIAKMMENGEGSYPPHEQLPYPSSPADNLPTHQN